MKALIFLVTALILLPAVFANAEDHKRDTSKQDDSVMCVVDHLEMTWGIKFKSLSKKESSTTCEFKITLEFTKELSDVKMLKGVFSSYSGTPGDFNQCALVFHLFDDENVSLNKYVMKGLEGDLTGVKGDGFRIILECDIASVKKAKKLEARLREAPKAK